MQAVKISLITESSNRQSKFNCNELVCCTAITPNRFYQTSSIRFKQQHLQKYSPNHNQIRQEFWFSYIYWQVQNQAQKPSGKINFLNNFFRSTFNALNSTNCLNLNLKKTIHRLKAPSLRFIINFKLEISLELWSQHNFCIELNMLIKY